MDLRSVRVISDDVKQMVEFYEQATGLPARWATEDFAELVAPSCTLAIGSTRTVQLFGEGSARPADNHSAIVGFLVDDVDEEYEKLKHLVSEFVQAPTTMPWGNRSLLFRDPDGNLVNFFAPLSQDAVKRLER